MINMFIGEDMARRTRQGVLNYSSKLESTQRLHFSRHRSQAKYRGELYTLTFEQYCRVWGEDFEFKGRNSKDLCMSRKDTSLGWCEHNVHILVRAEHISQTKSKNFKHRQTALDPWEIPDEIKHRI